MYRYILFDLDGTLSDPKVGICTSFQYALSKLGIDEPDIDKLEPVIGPPLKESFANMYNLGEEEIQQGIAYYRERYSDVGKFENEIYPGIPELLRDLKKKDRVVAVSSSKPTVYVEEILEHFGIREYFDYVVGALLDGTRDKKEDIINETIRQMFDGAEPDYDEIVMVGDRKYDIEAAINVGISNIGVTYGYGSREELEEAGATKIVNTVEGLRSLLLIPMGFSKPAPAIDLTGEGENPRKAKSPEDLKAMSKDISRKSFANTWGFVGPALMYWLGSSAFFYGLVFLTGLFFKNKAEYPEVLTVILFGLGHLIACLFVMKDFKSVAKHIKENAVTEPNFKFAIPAFFAELILAVAFGSFHKISALMQESAEEPAYVPPFVISLIVFGIMVPAASNFVFSGICYHRASKFMKGTVPMLFTIILCSFMERSTGTGFSLALMMGISIYIADKMGKYIYSLGTFIVSALVMAAVQFSTTTDAIYDDSMAILRFVGVAGVILILVNVFDKKEKAKNAEK